MLACSLDDFFIADLIDQHHTLDCFLLCDSNIDLFEGHRAVTLVEIVHTSLRVDSQEGGNVSIVRQSSTKGDNPDQLRSLLNLADRAADNGFKHWASRIMEQMDLINDDQFDQVNICAFTRLARDDIPLLGRSHDDLSLVNLLLRKMGISGKLPDHYAVVDESFLEISNDLSYKSLHGSDVDDLECLSVNSSVFIPLLGNGLQDSE